MQIALVQMEVIPGRPGLNVNNMLLKIDEAKSHNCNMIVFPEMAVGGYMLGDKWSDVSFCQDLISYDDLLREASDGICVIYGNVAMPEYAEGWHSNKDGRPRKYNAARVFYNRKPVKRTNRQVPYNGLYIKTNLPNYRIFDDSRYFTSLLDEEMDLCGNFDPSYCYSPFVIKDHSGKAFKFGVEICEDLWCEDYRFNNKPINPTKEYVNQGAECIINISASPWNIGKHTARKQKIKQLLKDCAGPPTFYNDATSIPFIYVNCVGVQNNGKNIVTFDGGTALYNSNATDFYEANTLFEEETLIVNVHGKSSQNGTAKIFRKDYIENDLAKISSLKVNGERSKNSIDKKYKAIIKGIRSLKHMMGISEHPKFVIGLSGGIDSSLVATLLVEAVGKDKIIGVNMPTKYNSDATKNAAKILANNLDIKYHIIPIGDIYSQIGDSLSSANDNVSQLNDENEQARIRGSIILAGLAARYGALFTNNGNKLETALGYSTLYGDVGGAIAPIGDLTKEEVFKMAKWVNRDKEIIPNNLLPNDNFEFNQDAIAPSAELKNAQKDPFKWGYHDALLKALTDYRKKSPEDIVKYWLDGTLHKVLSIDVELMKRWNMDNGVDFISDLEWFVNNMNKNVFKRIQAPPIIILSKSAYGFDIRESQLPCYETQRFRKLKKEILVKKPNYSN